MSATKLHADDTPVPVLAPGLRKTKLGRLWTYVRDDRPAGDQTPPAVWFAYTPESQGEASEGTPERLHGHSGSRSLWSAKLSIYNLSSTTIVLSMIGATLAPAISALSVFSKWVTLVRCELVLNAQVVRSQLVLKVQVVRSQLVPQQRVHNPAQE